MKIFLIKSAFFLVMLFPLGNVMACGGGGWEDDYRPHFFSSDYLSDTTYLRYFPDSPYCMDCDQLLRNAIIDEWASQFNQCDKKDIEAALFNLSPEKIKSLRDKVNPVPGNGFFSLLINLNRPELIDYLEFIIKENDLAVQEENYQWDDLKKDKSAIEDLLLLARKSAGELTDIFLKQKYIFQVVKLMMYNETYPELISYYQANINDNFPKNLTYYRTLGYYAGGLRKNKQDIKAKFLFARIFDKCPPIRHMAYKNFKYIDISDKEWDKCLALASDESEKSAFWIAQNIYEGYVNVLALKELYANDPSSSRLELALLKQMNNSYWSYMDALKKDIDLDTNKLYRNISLFQDSPSAQTNVQENLNWFQRIWQGIINFFKGLFGGEKERPTMHHSMLDEDPEVEIKPFALEEPWLGEMIELLEKINSEDKVKNKELFKLALGYAYTIHGEFDKGYDILKELNSSPDLKIKNQTEYLMLWGELVRSTKLSRELEEKLLEYFAKVQTNNHTFLDFQEDLKNELGRRYLLEKQYYKSLVIFGAGSRVMKYYTFDILNAIKEEAAHPTDSKFQSTFGKLDKKGIEVEQAKRLLFMGRFKEAAALDDNTLWFDPEVQGNRNKIVHYSDLAALDKKGGAENFLKIAEYLSSSGTWAYNAVPCYNYFFDVEAPGSYPFNVPNLAETMENRSNFNIRLNNSTELAEKYYRKAFNLTSSKEKKAEILFKAQALAMKDKYILRGHYSFEMGKVKSYYYKELRDGFSDTEFYKNAYNSCSFLRAGEITYY